ncbi:MAG: PAS domain S-box protein, partial [Fibrobacteres bacterium]|nr:PAS domain S-box protein [Fibrobacterota bacterium]
MADSIESKVLLVSTELLNSDSGSIDYSKITDTVLEISGAKYVVFNQFEENSKDFTTKAISGVNTNLVKISSLLGFELIGKRWQHDPNKAGKTSKSIITKFSGLQELVNGVLSSAVISLLEATFSIGEVYVAKISKSQYEVGDFTLIFSKGATLQNTETLQLFSNLVGLCIERNRALSNLKESEANFRSLADHGQALIWTSTPDKLCNYFNKVWLDFTGRTLEQELGNGWTEGVHPDDFQRCVDIYVTAFDKREKFSMDYRVRHKSGEYRWIQDDGTPRYDSKGNFAGYIGHCLDINERKKIEHELKVSKEHFELIFENSGTSNSIFDKDCRLILQNMISKKQLGTKSEEAYGRSVIEIFGPEKGKIVYERMCKVIQEKQSSSFETLFNLPTGKKWFHSIYQPILGEDGEVQYVQVVSQDITDHKKHEEALHKMQRLESLDIMAGGIAHDFNNLLTAITGNVEIAENKNSDTSIAQFLSKAKNNLSRAKSLAAQLLTFAQGGEPVQEVCHIFPFVKEIAEFA